MSSRERPGQPICRPWDTAIALLVCGHDEHRYPVLLMECLSADRIAHGHAVDSRRIMLHDRQSGALLCGGNASIIDAENRSGAKALSAQDLRKHLFHYWVR